MPGRNNSILEFNPATDANEGYYQCYASNVHGTAVSDVTHLRKALTPTKEPDPGAKDDVSSICSFLFLENFVIANSS